MKKIILLALAAASVAAFALPATASAITALHVVPKPEGAKVIHGVGTSTLQAPFGSITCKKSSGTATFVSTTTGTFRQTFQECHEPFGGTCTTEGKPVGTIETTLLPFHLATVVHRSTGAVGPGILVTPAGEVPTGHFASFSCPIVGARKVEGTGLIGTITKPACNTTGNEATISFTAASQAVQTHTTLANTPNSHYSLHQSAEIAHGTITLNEPIAPKLECT
jgi:hypothetical protein